MRREVDLCAYLAYITSMPRLNIYLPDDVYELASRWREHANLSEICAHAIRDEFQAANSHRSAPAILDALRPPAPLETDLVDRYGLAEVLVTEAPSEPLQLRETLGQRTARYLDQRICDGSILAMAGGRQTWCVVRNLSPRRVRVTITALGFQQTDPRLLHVHPNTLTTLLWLLYSPRSEAHLVGASSTQWPWSGVLPERDYVSYFVVASCSQFAPHSQFASLLGAEATAELGHQSVIGDFAYAFFSSRRLVPTSFVLPNSTIAPTLLRALSQRGDTRVMMVAGGSDKLTSIRMALKLGLCNCLITDTETAHSLLASRGGEVP